MIDENELIEYLRELKTYSKELMNHCELGSEAYFEGEVSAFNTVVELCKEMGKKKAGNRKHIVSLGVSDTGTFILAGCNTGGDVKVMPLNIREGQCFARIIDEDAEIHKSWSPIATFKHWFKVYDDFKLMYKIGYLKDDAVINVYTTSSNTDTIIIQRPKELLENRGEIGVAATIRPFGKWLAERDPDTGEINCLHCSMCDSDFHHTSIMMGYPYCPNCGSKMDDLNIYEVKSMKEGTENAY